MRSSVRFILAAAIIGKLFLAYSICEYFWASETLSELQRIPLLILIYAVLYIGLQLLTRKLSEVKNWWDWVYYVGLLAIMIPTFLATEKNQNIFNIVSDYGTICLILPVLVDGWNFVNNSTKTTK
jgi:hypothetical protein